MWAVKVPRTVALSNFDLLSNSISNIPTLLIAVLLTALALIALVFIVAIGWVCIVVSVGLLAFLSAWIAGVAVSLPEIASSLQSRLTIGAETIEMPTLTAKATWRGRLVDWFRRAIRRTWQRLGLLGGKIRDIIGYRQERWSINHILQITATFTVFFAVWVFAYLSADHYRDRIYNYSITDEWVCGEYYPAKFPSLDHLWELFQPLNAGFIVFDERFSARSSLVSHVTSGGQIRSEEGQAPTGDTLVSGCVTYVGDYGDWAYIVPRHVSRGDAIASPKGGYLITRSMIQEFTPVEPDAAAQSGGWVGRDALNDLIADAIETRIEAIYQSLPQGVDAPQTALLRRELDAVRQTVQEDRGRLDADISRLEAVIRAVEASSSASLDRSNREILTRLDSATDASRRDIASLREVFAALDRQVAEALAQMKDPPPSDHDHPDINDQFLAIQTQLDAVMALLERVPDEEPAFDWPALFRTLGEIGARLDGLEADPRVVVIDAGGGTGTGTGSGLYDGLPRRKADSINQLRRIAGDFETCFQTADPIAHVGFELNQTAVGTQSGIDEAIAVLSRVLDLEARDANSPPTLVFVQGRADSVGSPSVNQVVSEKRAASVQRVIEARLGTDLSARNVEIVAFGIGESIALLESSDTGGARSVDIKICSSERASATE